MAEAQKVPLKDLLPCPYNREIDQNKVQDIKTKVEETGEIKPFVVTEVNTDQGKRMMVTDGHHRYLALNELGMQDAEVPVVMADERGVDTAKEETPAQVIKTVPLDVLREIASQSFRKVSEAPVQGLGLVREDLEPRKKKRQDER